MQGLRRAGVLMLFLLLAAVYTRPLLERRATEIGAGIGDPSLSAAILWWSATTLPFSTEWWNAPYFYPSPNVSAYTENLVGVLPIAAPVFWLTHDPLTTYNIALFLSWPLSAFAMYLLVLRLTRRHDAAILAGLAFGFTPYRATELGHIQMVSTYWMPLSLLGLHAYLEDRRRRWLVLFASAWLLQSLANLYFMLFGAVLIAMWAAYFGSTRRSWRVLPGLVAAWSVAALALMPVLLKYRAVHQAAGLRRDLTEPLGYSITWHAWAEVSHRVWLWHRVFPDGDRNLFPGLVAVTLVAVCAVLLWRRGVVATPPPRRRIVLRTLGGLSLLSAGAALVTLLVGPWRAEIGGVTLRMTSIGHALAIAIVCGVPVLWNLQRLRAAFNRRSPFLFYACATIAMAVFALGPVLGHGNAIVLDAAPYRWLMALPGFDGLRVPERFWMLGVLCLAVAAGVGFAACAPRRRVARGAVTALLAGGVLLDGWMTSVFTERHPTTWPVLEPAGSTQPILELPLGPNWDAAATYRSIAHRRPVVNGVSGYDPAHYLPLQEGLNDRDPEMLAALASFGSFDIVISENDDQDRGWVRYVTAADGVLRVARDRHGAAYRVPAASIPEPALGARLRIVAVNAYRHDASHMFDGRLDTAWSDEQNPDQWVVIDLGTTGVVSGISQALADHARDFPRRLAVETSMDGEAWLYAWEGRTAAKAFRSAVAHPTAAEIRVGFDPRPARYVRLRQLATHRNFWWIAELAVYGDALSGVGSR